MLTSYGNGSMAMDLYWDYQQEAMEDLVEVCDICGHRHFEMVCPCCGGPAAVRQDILFKLARRPRPNAARLSMFLAGMPILG